jgi:hypothetical protein
MQLSNKKRASNKNLCLIYLLCVGASYLACISSNAMEEKILESGSGSLFFQHFEFMKLPSNLNLSSDRSLYELSQSEIFTDLENIWDDIINAKKETPKSNRRVSEVPKDFELGSLRPPLKVTSREMK